MEDVVVTINGRGFLLACADGGEARLAEVAAEVSRRLDALTVEHGPLGDDRLLLMLAVTLTDELLDRTAKRDTASIRAEVAGRAPTDKSPTSRTRKAASSGSG